MVPKATTPLWILSLLGATVTGFTNLQPLSHPPPSRSSTSLSLLPPTSNLRYYASSWEQEASSGSIRRTFGRPSIHKACLFTPTPPRGTISKWALLGTKKDDNEDEKDDDDTNSNNKKPTRALKFLPYTNKAVVQFLTSMHTFWNKIKWYVLTFSTGAVVALSALLVPLYYYSHVSEDNQPPIVQPVTLFETILTDLERNYVDEINVGDLFETGVQAMLHSLDPYTEFENLQQAQDMTESIEGKYGGVGLVIAGIPEKELLKAPGKAPVKALPQQQQSPQQQQKLPLDNDISSTNAPDADAAAESTTTVPIVNQPQTDPAPSFEQLMQDDDDDEDVWIKKQKQRQLNKGIRVVSAMEGYAFDYGMRVGDQLVSVDETDISAGTPIEQVRNALRGEPGTWVTISFVREGLDGVQHITMPRSLVKLRDVKLATLLGNPKDGIGYIQLSGFASEAGREMRNAIQYLQRAAEDANDGESSLQGLILDLRGNPGGLLTSAVDVSSLLVPKGSDIVSAKGRGFPGILYRSRVDPILDARQTKLAVLVNGNTASAAEIVSGAVQDLDVGIIVGADRTFGKGLVQNVEELPYNTALKFTVAKYYTPSGRCIQGTNYNRNNNNKDVALDESSSSSESNNNNNKKNSYVATKIEDKDRELFYTRAGRPVRDGGGVEADYKVPSQKASALEITLLRSGVLSDFAAEWSKQHELTNNFVVDEDTYQSFQNYVNTKQKSGELELEILYSQPLADLKKVLKASGYKGSEKSVEQLQARIVRDIQNDFSKYRNEIKEDISQNILARYLPESMLIERGVQKDPQVQAAIKLLSSKSQFDKLLAQGSSAERANGNPIMASSSSSVNVAEDSPETTSTEEGFRKTIEW